MSSRTDERSCGASEQGCEGHCDSDRGRGEPERGHQAHSDGQGRPTVLIVPLGVVKEEESEE